MVPDLHKLAFVSVIRSLLSLVAFAVLTPVGLTARVSLQ